MRHSVEFDGRIRIAFQDHIDLGVLLVEMGGRFSTDLGQVNGAWELVAISKGSTSNPARTLHRGEACKINDSWLRCHAGSNGFELGESGVGFESMESTPDRVDALRRLGGQGRLLGCLCGSPTSRVTSDSWRVASERQFAG